MQEDGIVGVRAVVPRWRSLRDTPAPELRPTAQSRRNHEVASPGSHETAILRWRRTKALEDAAEVIDGALRFGTTSDARTAAEQILAPGSQAVPMLKQAAEALLGGTNNSKVSPSALPCVLARDQVRSLVSKLKRKLSLNPRDALSAIEVARLQATIGQTKKASVFVDRALKSAPNNRFVIRSAARFYAHANDVEQALAVVARSEAVRTDPWIQAAEVALSDLVDRSPKWGVRRLRALSSRGSPGVQFRELAAGLSMLEFKNGSRKVARKLLEKSLANPTENVLAQALWFETTSESAGLASLQQGVLPSNAHEAQAIKAVIGNDTISAIDHARLWLQDEPFSIRPALYGSFVCSAHLDDHEMALAFADCGLRANPDDRGLLNNKLVSLASVGLLDEAKVVLDALRKHANDGKFAPYFFAARGIIAFNEGKTFDGRDFYGSAIEAALEHRDHRAAFLACAYWLENEASKGFHLPMYVEQAVSKLDFELGKCNSRIRRGLLPTWSAIKKRIMKSNSQNTLQNYTPMPEYSFLSNFEIV